MKYCNRILEKKIKYQGKRERLAQKNANKSTRRSWKGYKEFAMIPDQKCEKATYTEVCDHLRRLDFHYWDIDFDTNYESEFVYFAEAWHLATPWK
jgi:hypothetical protein